MSLITVNNIDVLSGTIIMPLVGVWTADLVIDQPDGSGFDAGTKVTISAPDMTLTGVVSPARTGDFLDAVHVRVLGGAGGMPTIATPVSFAQPGAYVRDVLNTLTSDSGETLSSTADAGILSTNLVAWAITQMPVSQALVLLLETIAPSANWRILADGTLWVGTESWPTSSATFELLLTNPSNGTFELGVESPSIVPGTTLDGVGKVNRVEHTVEFDKIRSHVWVDMPDGERGIAASIIEIATHAIPGIDYYALYDSKLVSQSADLTTVDVQPVDPRLPGMGRVPLRHGLPGCKVQVEGGAILRVGWDRGNPSLPFAAIWNGGESVNQISIDTALLELAGNTWSLPKWDDFLTDFTVWLGVLNTLIGTLVPVTGATGGPAYATAIALPTSIVVKSAVPANYESQKVKNG